jgi:hypothetical protein
MDFLARTEINLTNLTHIHDRKPAAIKVVTHSITNIGKLYIHQFTNNDGLVGELATMSALFGYNVQCRVNSSIPRRVRFYTLIGNQMQYLTTNDGRRAKCRLQIGCQVKFEANFKSILVATDAPCIISITIKATQRQCIDIKNIYGSIFQNGHTTLEPLSRRIRNDAYVIRSLSLANSLPRQLPTLLDPLNVNIQGLVYYLNLATIITITTHIEPQYRYPPYSVRLLQVGNLQPQLSYNIILKTSAGDEAAVTITAIETQSNDSYSIIKDGDTKLINQHTGTVATGNFKLPTGCFDVGLHIYTPFGFSGDIHDDKFTDLAKFLQYQIDYVLI